MNAAAPAVDGHKLFTVLGVVMLVNGYLSQVWLEALGQLYWPEIILPFVALAVLMTRWPAELFANLRFRVLAVGLGLMFIGYVLSDMVAGTAPSDYLRGWSRVVVLAADAISLAVIYHRNRWSLWWFVLGAMFYGFQVALVAGMSITQWKFGYAEPFTSAVMSVSALVPGWLSGISYLLLGAASIVLDYRSLGAILLVAGAILLMSRSVRKAASVPPRMGSRILVMIGVSAAAAGALALLANSASEYSQRRGASDITRFVGMKVGARAIADSPVLGYGSWGHGTEKYADMFFAETLGHMAEIGAENMMEHGGGGGFLPHSQILQAWVEGGILAALFFLAYGWFLVVTIRDLAFGRIATRFRGFLLLLLLLSLWHLVMSPFLGGHRLGIATSFALLVCGMMSGERRGTVPAQVQPIAFTAPPNLLR